MLTSWNSLAGKSRDIHMHMHARVRFGFKEKMGSLSEGTTETFFLILTMEIVWWILGVDYMEHFQPRGWTQPCMFTRLKFQPCL